MSQPEHGKKMSLVIAQCWADEAFKRKLLADPAATLKAEGVEVPAGLSIRVLADDDKVHHLVIPEKLTGSLSDEALVQVAGGGPAAGSPGWVDPDPNPIGSASTVVR